MLGGGGGGREKKKGSAHELVSRFIVYLAVALSHFATFITVC